MQCRIQTGHDSPAWPTPKPSPTVAPANWRREHAGRDPPRRFSFGYRATEIDVKLSGDGIAAADARRHHQPLLGRARARPPRPGTSSPCSTPGRGTRRPYAGEPIPTYRRVAKYCIANGVMLNTEIKPCIGRERETGAAVALETQALFSAPEHAHLKPLLSSVLHRSADRRPRRRARVRPRPSVRKPVADRLAGALQGRRRHRADANWRTLTPDIVNEASRQRPARRLLHLQRPGRRGVALELGRDSVITDAVDKIAFRSEAQPSRFVGVSDPTSLAKWRPIRLERQIGESRPTAL